MREAGEDPDRRTLHRLDPAEWPEAAAARVLSVIVAATAQRWPPGQRRL
jgi:hypothetical protein